jgi:hypothetical protein
MTGKSEDSMIRSMMNRSLREWIISRDFLLALLVTCALASLLLSNDNDSFKNNVGDILILFGSASATLLGLVIAAYSIFASFGQASYLYVLKKSRIYDDTVMQFAWCGTVLIAAVVLSILTLGVNSVSSTSETLAISRVAFVLSTFFMLYGLFLVGVLITSSLRMVNVLRGEFVEATEGKQ